MADLSYTSKPLFTPGEPNNVDDVLDRFDEVKNYVNGSGWVNNTRLTAGAASGNVETSGEWAKLGISNGSTTRRGKSIIATEESFTQTSYGFATTPDRVQNVVLPTDGLIFVAFQGAWKESVLSSASAAVFLGSNQLQLTTGQTGPAPQSAGIAGSGSYFVPLSTSPQGLSSRLAGSPDTPADVTTGQLVSEGCMTIFAAAGTYDVGVKFKSSSGSVTVKNRRLWVWTQAF